MTIESQRQGAGALLSGPGVRTPAHGTRARSGNMPQRVFVVSDVHTDYPSNLEWVKQLEDYGAGMILVLAGDVSHRLDLLKETLTVFKSKFEHVFFTPGNHDLWLEVRRTLPLTHAHKLSLSLSLSLSSISSLSYPYTLTHTNTYTRCRRVMRPPKPPPLSTSSGEYGRSVMRLE